MNRAHSKWRLARIPALAGCVLLVFAAAIWPQPPVLPGQPSDTVQHAAAFTVLTLAMRWACPGLGGLALLLWLSGFGLVIELTQALLPLGRSASLSDWGVDCLAILTTVGALELGRWTGRLLRHRTGG